MRHHEFWPPRLFETPYYLYLLAQCAWLGITPKTLAKANFGLDHGELGLGSKYTTQMAFDQEKFLPTVLVRAEEPARSRQEQLRTFASTHGFPLILKPDIGAVGKGVVKITDAESGHRLMNQLSADHLLQQFTPHEIEFGIFFVRKQGTNLITGMNQKHFPTVVGDGVHTIAQLAEKHERYTQHWSIFLKYIDTNKVPMDGERIQLSFIGSHTMGCKFTDDSSLVTNALSEAVFKLCDTFPGFNFGRLDVKAASIDALLAGDFCVIEVNGIASLPTHMFDPDSSALDAYKIFLSHGKLLAEIADEHRSQSMQLDSYTTIWRRATSNARLLNKIHADAKSAS